MVFTVAMLNHRIEKLPYGREEMKDKPSATLTELSIRHADKDHKLQERSAQTWCLMQIFPFLVKDKVDANDPYLHHIIRLNKIHEYVFSPAFKKSNIIQLNELVFDHIQSFQTLFPDVNAINKLHHLTHYALCMTKSRPLRHLACFKYEAKHQMFKKYGSIFCNFKNIFKTMANISQTSQCQKKTIRKKIEESASVDISKEVATDVREAADINLQLLGNVKLCNKIGVYGITYRVGSLVAIDGSNYGSNLPLFGRIVQVVNNNDEVYLYCKDYESLFLDESLNAYCVEEGNNYGLVAVKDLRDRKKRNG